MYACRPAGESRKSMNANSDRLKPSSTRRALASLGVHPCRFAMRLRRFPLSIGRRMLMTIEWVVFTEPPPIVALVSIVACGWPNYYFAHDSSGFPILLRFCDAQSGRSFHRLHHHSGPVARTWQSVRSIVAESLLLKHQLLIVNRSRQR